MYTATLKTIYLKINGNQLLRDDFNLLMDYAIEKNVYQSDNLYIKFMFLKHLENKIYNMIYYNSNAIERLTKKQFYNNVYDYDLIDL